MIDTTAPVNSVNYMTGDVILGASDIGIDDIGGYYSGNDVETALQEIGGGTTLDPRYVNVTGDTMTGELDMSDNQITDVGYMDFNLANGIATAEGRLKWNPDDGTLEVGLPGGNVNLQIGEETLVRATNDQGVQIDNGKMVIISGGVGSFPNIKYADKSSIATAGAIGMATEDIATGQKGYVTNFGLVRDVDTDGIAAGVPLWLGDDGAYTSTRPTAPDISTVVGTVIRSHATEGVVFLHPQVVPRLRGLSDVYSPSTPHDGAPITWNDSTSRWEQDWNAVFKPAINSTTALQIQQEDGTVVFNADTVNGRVGIGTDSPDESLQIVGGKLKLTDVTGGTATLSGTGSSSNQFISTGWWGFTAGDNSGINFYVNVDTVNKAMVIKNTRQVGIDTGTPLAKFHVKGTLDETQTIIQAHSTQTQPTFVIRSSSGTALSGVDERGILFSDGGVGNSCLIIGDNAGNPANMTGFSNTVAGVGAGVSLTSGGNNTIIGQASGTQLTTSGGNMFLGTQAGWKITGANNVAIGNLALGSTNGSGVTNSVFIGQRSGVGATSGTQNTFVGYRSAEGVLTGHYNSGLGVQTGFSLTSGQNNIFLGYQSGYRQTTASNLFIVDATAGVPRADIATELTNSILYGSMGATPDIQTLRINATLTTSQGRIVNTTRVTTTYTALVTDHMIYADTDGGAFTLTLPVGVEGQMLKIVSVGSSGNTLEVDPDGTEELFGGGAGVSFTMYDNEGITIVYNSVEGWR